MSVVRRVVDNRVFLLGLDGLYREAMKRHERGELLTCVRIVAQALDVEPWEGPVEGYYSQDAQLTQYFRWFRALQDVDERAASTVEALGEFQRLKDIASSPIYGRPVYDGKLFPVGRDSLSQALIDMRPNWRVESLTNAAHGLTFERDDFSLVGLAARIKDAVVLTALRESVVLYAEMALLDMPPSLPKIDYVWQVDEDLAAQASRFIDAFNHLFGEALPPAGPQHAERYWVGYADNDIVGRCVRLGWDDSSPALHYHWAISRGADGKPLVNEFWQPEIWTTERYSEALRTGEPPLPL